MECRWGGSGGGECHCGTSACCCGSTIADVGKGGSVGFGGYEIRFIRNGINGAGRGCMGFGFGLGLGLGLGLGI